MHADSGACAQSATQRACRACRDGDVQRSGRYSATADSQLQSRGKPDHVQRLEIWKLYTQKLGLPIAMGDKVNAPT